MIVLKPDRRVARFAARFPVDPKDKTEPPGMVWDVFLDLRGTWVCECHDFYFRNETKPDPKRPRKRRPPGPCKHIIAAALAYRASTNRANFDT